MDVPGIPDPQGGPIPQARVAPPRHASAGWDQAHSYPGPGIIPAPGPLRGLVFTIIGIPLAVILLIAIAAAASNGGSGNSTLPSQFGGGNGAGLPQQFYRSSTTTDPNTGVTPADEPQTQSTLATSDEFGQTPTTGLSDTPTDSGFGTDSRATAGSAAPTGTSATTASTATGTSTPTATGPDSTVSAYFAAINARNYQAAWNLGGKNLDGSSVAHFSAGFSQTRVDVVTIKGVSGDVVSVDLTSLQTDGALKSYTGTYTVVSGVITSASVTQTS